MEFQLQTHQRLLKSVYNTPRLLLYHGIGSGKTCTAVSLAASFRRRYPKRRIYVIVPASLRGNFVKEANGPCGDRNRMTSDDFDIMSYQGFTKRYKQGSIDLHKSMVIVDEIQNVLSQTGDMYKTFLSAFHSKDDFNAVLLTATPMFDRASEIALLGNLLLTRDDPYRLPTHPGKFHKLMSENPKVVYTFFKDKVSYYRGADPRQYPQKIEHVVECPMSSFQEKVYMKSIGHIEMNEFNSHLERAFLITPRQSANLVLTSTTVGKLTHVDQTFDVRKHSPKFFKCIQYIRSNPGPAFVYSNFVSVSGTEAFARILRYKYMYAPVIKNQVPRSAMPRYAVFRANDPVENNRIVRIFNSPQNKDGSLIKVIIGSPAMKEGVSLLRVRSVHILDPYWNRSRTEQIMGRAVSFRSHADLPENERKVDVYHYYAVPSDKKLSVDLRILQMANTKIRKIRILETILQETAFDCNTFRAFNEPPEKHCFRHDLVSNRERDRLLSTLIVDAPTEQTNNAPVIIVPTNNQTNIIPPPGPVVPNNDVPKKPTKPLTFGTIQRDKKKRKKKNSCPSKRRPDELTDACPEKYPYSRPNSKGHQCCFKRPLTRPRVPRVTICPPDKVLNPRTKRCVLRTSKIGKLLSLNLIV